MKVQRLDQNHFRALLAHRRQITAKGKKPRKYRRFQTPVVPTAQIIKYRKFLESYFTRVKDSVNRNLVPRLPGLTEHFYKDHPELSRKDDATSDLKQILSQIMLDINDEFSEEDLEQMATLIGAGVANVSRVSFLQNLKDVANIDLFLTEPWLDTTLSLFAVQNASLIKGSAQDAIDKVSGTVFNAFRNGDRAEAITEDIQGIFEKMTVSKAEFIARDQISKLGGQFQRLRQTEIGVKSYTWRGMDDGRERDTHLENNDEIFDWDDPPVETGHPGEDYNCRCWAEPVLDDVLNGTDEGDDQDQGDESENEP